MMANTKVTKTFSVDTELYDKFERLSKKMNLNKSSFIEKKIKEFINESIEVDTRNAYTYRFNADEDQPIYIMSKDIDSNKELYVTLSDGNRLKYDIFEKICIKYTGVNIINPEKFFSPISEEEKLKIEDEENDKILEQALFVKKDIIPDKFLQQPTFNPSKVKEMFNNVDLSKVKMGIPTDTPTEINIIDDPTGGLLKTSNEDSIQDKTIENLIESGQDTAFVKDYEYDELTGKVEEILNNDPLNDTRYQNELLNIAEKIRDIDPDKVVDAPSGQGIIITERIPTNSDECPIVDPETGLDERQMKIRELQMIATGEDPYKERVDEWQRSIRRDKVSLSQVISKWSPLIEKVYKIIDEERIKIMSIYAEQHSLMESMNSISSQQLNTITGIPLKPSITTSTLPFALNVLSKLESNKIVIIDSPNYEGYKSQTMEFSINNKTERLNQFIEPIELSEKALVTEIVDGLNKITENGGTLYLFSIGQSIVSITESDNTTLRTKVRCTIK